MTADATRVLVTAGGTGGHVFPALAVAAALAERGADVCWLGAVSGIETRLVPAAGYPLTTISVAGLRGKGARAWLAAPVRVLRALAAAVVAVRRVGPHAVLAMGGFAAGPGGAAAWLLRRPLVVHEQNAAAGLTNRVLARLANPVLQAFPDTFDRRRRARTVGNPVRAEILALAPPADRWCGRSGPIRLLVLGGSGGALAINERVPAALGHLVASQRPAVRHQAGQTIDAALAAYRQAGVVANVEAFIDDMAAAYAWADVVICRSGALTVAELAAAGLPAVLVPYPHAVDDHQRANGGYLARAGAAELIDQDDATEARLAELIERFCSDRGALLARAEAARGCAWPRSAETIADAVLAAGKAL